MEEPGQSLRAERIRQGLTLKSVSEKTRVSVSVLQYLEEGEYAKIGTPLLVRSFIRAYGVALGMNPEPLLDARTAEIQSCDMQPTGIRNYRRLSAANQAKRKRRVILLLVLAAVMVIAAAVGFWVVRNKSRLFPTQSLSIIGPDQDLPMDLAKPAVPPPDTLEAAKTAPAAPPRGLEHIVRQRRHGSDGDHAGLGH